MLYIPFHGIGGSACGGKFVDKKCCVRCCRRAVEIVDDFIPTCRLDGDIIVGMRHREKEF
jgi:hypothetical protein